MLTASVMKELTVLFQLLQVIDNEKDGGVQIDKQSLTSHPCKKVVLHFLKKIIVDNMLTATGKVGEFFETIVQVAFYFPLDFCFFFHMIEIWILQSV